ncbi:hypothetical protein IAE35_15470 [Pseudomonas sp. S75]|uniref:hypothetical protein n=1 Tax=unclassified Pseudomonas TaxID=196821 RepID=UPI0019067E9B|nr:MULTISPECIES: hypothetical protein [unclassified Pseudomonas]MBJ9975786.1 hypothetical protein [Pseudomonas sp. S30]MBK0154744.1 hypothetical protein [Pseudomonas sp. S75]
MEIVSNGVNTFTASRTDAKDGQSGPPFEALGISQPVVSSPPTSTARLSSLSQQLSAAAERAAVRDSQLSRKALAALASHIHEQIEGEQYWLFKDTYDSQRPDTDDAQWLERVQQATDFVNGKAPNPFKGMSREQLSLITHDQEGSFTINERRAASAEAGAQEFEWAKYIIDKMDAERRSTGRSDQAMLETIAHYDSLPRIDVAAHGNYEAAIRNTMQMHEFEVQLPTVGTSLLEQLANEWGDSDELPNSQLSGLATYSSADMSAVLNDSAISTRDQSARVAIQQSPADLELSALAQQLHAAALRASARDS